VIAVGVPTILINGLPVSVMGDNVVGPVLTGVVTMGSPTMLMGGRPVNRVTSPVVGVNTVSGVPLSSVMLVGVPTILVP
jgi:uncharacterized Zn-binding protein involved in type VI secretion